MLNNYCVLLTSARGNGALQLFFICCSVALEAVGLENIGIPEPGLELPLDEEGVARRSRDSFFSFILIFFGL